MKNVFVTAGSVAKINQSVLTDNVNINCYPELDSGADQCCELPVTPVRFRIKYGMTLNDIPSLPRRSLRSLLAMTCCAAFTMAEILLSLTIIGVVAAITLPSLTGNINERTWNTQRKTLYARFS